MRQTVAIFFGAEFEVKYSQAKYENPKCCPKHGASNAPSAGLAFSAVTIAVYEAFLLPAAEIGAQEGELYWHQDCSLIFIAKPRRRTDSNHNTEL
jgi:hypothetical protein